LAVCERLLGANHLKALSTRKSLASAYREAGEPEKAGSGDTRSPPTELVDRVEGRRPGPGLLAGFRRTAGWAAFTRMFRNL
jgi:hypothetical protein